MGVVHLGAAPGLNLADADAQFFFQLTAQRLRHAFAGFQFAPWELPVARVHLARRA